MEFDMTRSPLEVVLTRDIRLCRIGHVHRPLRDLAGRSTERPENGYNLRREVDMRIVPVIDLKDGVVVRGVAGQRARYRPVVSVIAQRADPKTVAQALVETTGARELYVADLDAIAGSEPDWSAYGDIASAGATLLIDAGIRDPDQAQTVAEYAGRQPLLTGIIASLESSVGPRELAAVLAAVGSERCVFSLDLKDGLPMTSASSWGECSAEQIADLAVQIGFRRTIVLDVARVGVSGGPGTLPLCRGLRSRYPQLEIIAGGGIRDVSDLEHLAESGCDAALVASALHNGTLTASDVQRFA
jgi:phosphoribosylformimino-5-aminoimidazole carboxamide ribotide isomerase